MLLKKSIRNSDKSKFIIKYSQMYIYLCISVYICNSDWNFGTIFGGTYSPITKKREIDANKVVYELCTNSYNQ